MKAIGKYVIIDPIIEGPRKTEGGLLLTEKSLEVRYTKGKVVTPGTDCTALKTDDVIYYDKHAGHIVEFDGETYTVIIERDVVIVL